jgi:hypothetical protein
MSAVIVAFPFGQRVGLRPLDTPRLNVDEAEREIKQYAIGIGCTASNVAAAMAYGVKHGHDTTSAVREGKRRACVLLSWQPKESA